MTILDKTFSGQLGIVNSLNRLASVLAKRRVHIFDPVYDQAVEYFADVKAEEKKYQEHALKNLDVAGEIPKITEELYNPSFDDSFGMDSILASFTPPGSINESPDYPTVIEDSDTRCLVNYLLKENGNIVAKIKNYIHLEVLNITYHSRMYPMIGHDNMTSNGRILGGYMGNTINFRDDLTSSGRIIGGDIPIKVIYTSITIPLDNMESRGYIIGGSVPNKVIYSSYTIGTEEMSSRASIIAGSIPLKVNYIAYVDDPTDENLTSSGQIISGTLGR